MTDKEMEGVERTINERFLELKKEINELKEIIESFRSYQTLHNTNNLCTDGFEHVYPNPWFATVSPHCLKCGKQAPSYGVSIGIGGWGVPNTFKVPDNKSSDAAGFDFEKFGGNQIYLRDDQLPKPYVQHSNPPIDLDNTTI